MFYPARMRCLVVILLALVFSPSLLAQKTEADIRARLVGKRLYLRGLLKDDKLAFDATGHLLGSSAPAPFTLSGMDVQDVKLTSKGLELDGVRVGIIFQKDLTVSRLNLQVPKSFGGTDPEKLVVRIAKPADGDYTTALDAIFTLDLADLVSEMPFYWQKYARSHFMPKDSEVAGVASQEHGGSTQLPPGSTGLRRIGGGVKAPVLTYQAEPEFTQAARGQKLNGVVLVSMIVDTSGNPTQVQVLRPVGLGLDENAVASVSTYRFRPAMLDDKPVPVELNVEVNFQIF
jgi:TonB family protein